MSNGNADDDDHYVDLSDDEIVVENDDDDLSDLYPGKFWFYLTRIQNNKVFSLDFRRLRTNDSGAGTTTESPKENGVSGTKRKAEKWQVRDKKKMDIVQWIVLVLDQEPQKKMSRTKFETYATIRWEHGRWWWFNKINENSDFDYLNLILILFPIILMLLNTCLRFYSIVPKSFRFYLLLFSLNQS